MATAVDLAPINGADERDNDLAPADLIARIAEGKLRAFAGTVDVEAGVYLDDVYAQNKSLSEHAAADYHGRFLIELIQNANDVHERGRQDGRIEIALEEDEGDFGTLYVANMGKPFAYENVVALSRIGMSSKPPGEAIGNKGLGFRSVSHVCDAPEIYSQCESPRAGAAFEGFCFTFARPVDLEKRIANPTILALAQSDLPMFFLPIALENQAATVRAYAERGFSSVIRLPLRDDASLRTAKEEIEALDDDSAPLLLFLDRLELLKATIGSRDSAISRKIELARHEDAVHPSEVDAAVITLSGARWLLIRDEVPEAPMLQAIQQGVAAKQLHSSWSDWSGIGEVALAVPLDGEISTPRLYTFLPMGEGATAPLQGHLHGSFFPTSNRKALDAGVALNCLLLKRAAGLAARSLLWLAGRESGKAHEALDPEARARASIDLMVWGNPASLTAAKNAADRLDLGAFASAEIGRLDGDGFASAPVVPCAVSVGGIPSIGWKAARSARGSFEASGTFDLSVVARHGAAIEGPISLIWPDLGGDRAKRLSAYLRAHAPDGFRDRLAPAECAKIAAKVAASLRAGRRPATTQWSAFYRDLPSFMKDGPDALAGHAVILCDDGTVRAARSDVGEGGEGPRLRRRRRRGDDIEPSLFFPPAARQAGDSADVQLEQLKVPAPLARYFAFAGNMLPWHGELRAAREFLERGLVSPYDGETVLTRISQVVNAGASVEEAIAGLRWAFAIWRRASQANRPLKVDSSYRLLVPAGDTLIPATDAVFSETWPEELLGKRLHALFGAAPPDVDDFVDFKKRFLAPTSHRAFGKGRAGLWAEFLKGLGVRCGLRALPLPALQATRAYEVTSLAFAKKLGISEAAVGEWRQDLTANMPNAFRLGYSTNYKFAGPLWWLPGQGDHTRFSDDCREIYAGLVVEWLSDAPKDVFKVDLRHEHFSSDHSEWTTPVGAFLRSGAWLPADDPSSTGPTRRYFRPGEVWVSGAMNERFPFYLRQVAVSVGKVIERRQNEVLKPLRVNARLRVLNNPATVVQQARFLAEQYAAGTVRAHYEPQLVNLYNSTWRMIGERHAADPQSLAPVSADTPLLVRRRSQLTVVVPGKAAAPVYVRDSEDELAPSLISSLDGLLLDIKGADRKRISSAVDALFGKRVRRLSTMHYDVKIDGVGLDHVEVESSVLDACPWLRPMLAIAMESLRGPEAAQLPSDRGVILTKLADVGFVIAKDVLFEVNGQSVSASEDRPAYVFRRPAGSSIVVVVHDGSMSWSALQACVPAICDAIDLPSVANGIRLLAHELAAIGEDIDEAIVDDGLIARLCRVLQLEEGSLASIQLLVGERADARLPWIRAALYYSGGRDALIAYDRLEAAHPDDPVTLMATLIPLMDSAGLDPEAILAACRQAQTDSQFRELLDFDFARFNDALVASGSELLAYPAVHASQLLNHIVDQEVAILEALRNEAAARLEKMEPAPEYAKRRDALRALSPDPTWLPRYHFVPDETLANRVRDWLMEIGAPALGTNPNDLPALVEVRTANQNAIGKFAAAASPVVRAWWRGPSTTLPDYWREAKAAEQHIRSKLDAAGVVDFKPLSEATLIAWCVKVGLWPDGMPQTLDRSTLGIGEKEVDAAEQEARREAEERAAKARSVRVNDQDVDPEHADWTAISEEIATKLSRQVKAARLTAPTDLVAMGKRPPREPGNRKPRDIPIGPDRTPQAKKDMIGRLGELVVYHWLKDRFRNQDIDKAWVSRFAAQQKGKAWSDDLGYDFEIKHDRRTWLIEVKASQGDRCQFEMGESEVRAARDAARARSGQKYVVIYVANPATSDATRIDILPNPMSEEADGILRLLGEGVRFGFQPK